MDYEKINKSLNSIHNNLTKNNFLIPLPLGWGYKKSPFRVKVSEVPGNKNLDDDVDKIIKVSKIIKSG